MECLFCGAVFEKGESESNYICGDCKRKMTILKQLEKLDKAVDYMIKARERYFFKCKQYDYQDEKYKVSKKILSGDCKFNSTEEACIAVECEREGIQYCPNFKIGNYNVDFFLSQNKSYFGG